MRALKLIAAVVGLVLLYLIYRSHYGTVLLWWFRSSLFWVLPLLLLAGLYAAFTFVNSKIAFNDVGVLVYFGFAGLVLVAGLTAAIWWTVSTHGYLQARAYYTASAKSDASAMPSLGQRAPFQVAEAQAGGNFGDISGKTVDTTYLPATGNYASLAVKPGFNGGYAGILDQRVPLAGGSATGTTCTFASAAAVHDGGWFGRNLSRAIDHARRGARYDSSDLYSYCSGSTPIVVVPLVRQTGWLVVTERPDGVALYNGRTGKLTIRDSANDLPGPAYPLSLAAKQREALQASDGYWDYRAGRSGLQASDNDTNSGNTTEFVLPLTGSGNRPAYATMLTGRGSARGISAISVVDGRPRAGTLAPITIYKTSPGWTSPDAITARISADYQDIPNWQTLHVREVAPTDSGHWAATITSRDDLYVLYRVVGSGNLGSAPATCLYRADGTQIRCGTLADTGQNGVGTQYGSNGSAPSASSDLSKLTDAQLAQLQSEVAGEVAKRLTSH